MQQHLNQQHNVKLTHWNLLLATSYDFHAAQLWRPVKVQTFFQSRRYIRYFIVQEQEQEQEHHHHYHHKQYSQNQAQQKLTEQEQRLSTLQADWESTYIEDSRSRKSSTNAAAATALGSPCNPYITLPLV